MLGQQSPIVIIGGGIAGSAAALRAAQYNLAAIWFTGSASSKKKSRSQWVRNIDNMLGVHPAIVKKKLAVQFKRACDDAGLQRILNTHLEISTQDIIHNAMERIAVQGNGCIEIKKLDVLTVAKQRDQFTLFAQKQNKKGVVGDPCQVSADFVVLGTGVMDQQPLLPWIDKTTGGVTQSIEAGLAFANHEDFLYCIRCEGHLTTGHPIAIMGHQKNAAMVAACLFERYGGDISILTQQKEPDWGDDLQTLMEHYGITIYKSSIRSIEGQPGNLKGVTLEGDEVVPCRFIIPMLGIYQIYNDLARQIGARLESGPPAHKKHVVVNAQSETSVPNFFAIGDLCMREDEPIMKQVYTAQEYAVRAIDTIERRIRMAHRKIILSR